MRKFLLLFPVILAGCNSAPTSESFSTPNGATAYKIKCSDNSNGCYEQAKVACSGGSYQVLDSESRQDGVRTRYSMSIACGKSDGKLASFPSKDAPASGGNTVTRCFNAGFGVTCNSW